MQDKRRSMGNKMKQNLMRKDKTIAMGVFHTHQNHTQQMVTGNSNETPLPLVRRTIGSGVH